jgi:hypothetical protein
VRLDEEFPDHPKVAAAGPLAIAMQVAALCYCNRKLTDGFVPRGVARSLLDWEIVDKDDRVWRVAVHSGRRGVDVTCAWVIDVLVSAGIWEEVPGGYQIHDFLAYQPSRVEVEARKEQTAEAGRKGGQARAAKRTGKRDAKRTAGDTSIEPLSALLSEPPDESLSGPSSETVANHQAEPLAKVQAKSKPGPGTDRSNSSSSVERVLAPDAADDDDDGGFTEAIRLTAERRLERQAPGKVRNPKGWLATVRREITDEASALVRALLEDGMTPAQVAAEIEADPPPEAPTVEFRDCCGTSVNVPHRVGCEAAGSPWEYDEHGELVRR